MKLKSLFILALLFPIIGLETDAQEPNEALLSPVISNSELLNLKLPDVVISSVELNEKGTFSKVLGIIGKEIKFELLLPLQWNQRFAMGGGGGFVEGIENGARFSVNQGFATAGTDTGHESSSLKADWAYNNMERQVNFGHLAIHRTALVSKSIIDIYYGIAPKYSYFMGCSRGGGQALIEAQRYPEDFDGIIAGAPVIDWPGTLAKFVRNAQLLFPNPEDLSTCTISEKQVQLLNEFILEQCDELDGVKDNILNDPSACNPDLSLLLSYGKDSDPEVSFTREQISIIEKIYGGLHLQGEEIYPGFAWGSESEWWGWIVGPHPWAMSLNFPTFEFGLGTEGAKYLIFNDQNWDYSNYDFSDFRKNTSYAAAYLNASSTDYSKFENRGGKMIIYHGWNDGALSVYTSIEHYEAAKEKSPGIEEYIRLFLLPGVQHCGGGPGPSSAGWLKLISDWVENGEAPERIIVSKYVKNELVMSRPVYPYPAKAVYKGTGDTNDESSFVEKKK